MRSSLRNDDEIIDLAARRRAIRSMLPLIGAALQTAQIALFALLGFPSWMVWASVSFVAIYLVAALILQLGHARVGVWIGFVEMIAHVAIFTIVFGARANYLFFFGPIAIAAFLVFGSEEKSHRIVWVTITILVTPLLLAWDRYHAPLFALSAPQLASLMRACTMATLLAQIAELAWFARVSDRADAAVVTERQRTESLLNNVFPTSIAERLKDSPGAIAEATNNVSVLFADIVGFTPMAEKMTPTELVTLLDAIFCRFDELADRYGLEKIKTIGDAYLVVGGIPEAHADPVGAMAKMALAMRDSIRELAKSTAYPIDIRIGIATGPVVAGVIGKRRFAYDLWGDTVNTAARMESHGAPGEIQVTKEVREALDERFDFEPRGTIHVKGKGEMTPYWLKRSR